MKIGLYSITYLGVWYGGPALTLEQVIKRARQYGYDGIEIDGKRPHGHPLDLTRRYCQDLVHMAHDASIQIYAVAANNDFSSPIPEYRDSQLLYMRELIRMASDLHVKTVRVFAAWPGVTMTPLGGQYTTARKLWREAHLECTDQQTWDWCRDGLRESARWAGELGVTLALQNHPPVTNNPADMLRMIHDVDSPYLMACLDAPLAAKQNVGSMRQAVYDTGALQVLSHFGGEYHRGAEGSVQGFVRNPDLTLTPESYYADFLQGLLDIGYGGYLGYELCHPLPQVDGKTVGIEFADLNASLAVEYMKQLVTSAKHAHATAATTR